MSQDVYTMSPAIICHLDFEALQIDKSIACAVFTCGQYIIIPPSRCRAPLHVRPPSRHVTYIASCQLSQPLQHHERIVPRSRDQLRVQSPRPASIISVAEPLGHFLGPLTEYISTGNIARAPSKRRIQRLACLQGHWSLIVSSSITDVAYLKE